jgi:hypothetical protein
VAFGAPGCTSDEGGEADPQSGDVAGTVTDGATGAGIAGASVRAEPLDPAAASTGEAVRQADTDSAGAFSLSGLAAGDYRLAVTAEGYEPFASEILTVAPGGDRTVEIQLAQVVAYASTCEACHLQTGMLLASLADDPLPEGPGEGGSAGEG